MFDLILGGFVKIFLFCGTLLVGLGIKLGFGDPDFANDPDMIIIAYTILSGFLLSFIWAISR